MNKDTTFHPLDNLISNTSFSMLEAMVPFVAYQYKKPLVLFIKYQELMSIFRALDDRQYISACGFDCHPNCMEDMINDMCTFMPKGFADSLRQMQQAFMMMDMMNSIQSSADNDCTSDTGCNNLHDKNINHGDDNTSLYDSVISIINEYQ